MDKTPSYAQFQNSLAWSVAVHEFGHLAHAFHAKGTAADRGFEDTTPENVRNWVNWEDPQIVANTQYGQRNSKERFAEWFLAYFSGMETGVDKGYEKEIERHLSSAFVFKDGRWIKKDENSHYDTFEGSSIFYIALARAYKQANSEEPVGD